MDAATNCGTLEILLFCGALVAGTACTLTSKVLLSMKSHGLDGEQEDFSYPLFQTLGMFIGMFMSLFIHFIVKFYKIPFPGYIHETKTGKYIDFKGAEIDKPATIPWWMYFILFIPSMFDLAATTLCMYGLRYVNVSIYQMLRGSAIVFVALLKQFVLKHPLKKYMWVGIFWNVVSIVLTGLTVMLSSEDKTAETALTAKAAQYGNPMIGVFLILCGALVQSLQYAFEEKVMTGTGDEMAATPPLLLIGMEGLWGTVICLFILYPIAYATPGPDHGSLENPFNTYEMIAHSTAIQGVYVLYFVSVLAYNILAVLVTFTLNSVWHAILDNFRPLTVWGVDLLIFYVITSAFGESWTVYSFVQLLGMFVLLYGTAIYNAPNAGSIKLTGGIWNCFIDFSKEYEYTEIDEFDAEAIGTTPAKVQAENAFYQMSPFLKSPAIRAGAGIEESPYKNSILSLRQKAANGAMMMSPAATKGGHHQHIGGSASKVSKSTYGGSLTPPRHNKAQMALEMSGKPAANVNSGVAANDKNMSMDRNFKSGGKQ